MKIMDLKTPAHFSEAAVEQAIIDIQNESQRDVFSLHLTISIYDVELAKSMMTDGKYFKAVRYVTITPEFKDGEWSLVDDLNKITIKSGEF